VEVGTAFNRGQAAIANRPTDRLWNQNPPQPKRIHFFTKSRSLTAALLLTGLLCPSVYAAVTFSGNFTQGTTTSNTIVGGNSTGNLTIDGGSTLSNRAGFVGNGTGGIGTVTISSGSWSNNGSLTIGNNGTGTLNISGGTVSSTSAFLGNRTTGNGTVELSGGSWTNSSPLRVGSSGTGTLNISGGNLTNTMGEVGFAAGSKGVVTVSAGAWTNSSYLRVGASGTGTLNISGGNVSNTTYALVGAVGTAVGTVSASGGTWTIGSYLTVADAGTGTLNISGGTVTATSGTLGNYAGSNATATVSNGTWTNSGNLTVGSSGTGTLSLTGGNVSLNAGSGTLSLAQESFSNGTLNFGTGSSVGNLEAARIAGGNGTAVVNFNHSSNSSFSHILEGNLTVNKLGSGTTTLTANNTYTGATSVQNGQLNVDGELSSTVTVQGGAGISGSGRVGGLILDSGSTLSPGNSPGTFEVTGNATWNAGANYNWQVYSPSTDPAVQSGAGTDWDFFDVGGTLTLGLDGSNRFNLNLWSLSGPDTSGAIPGWDANLGSTWLIARAQGGILLDGSALSMNTDYSGLFNINTGPTNGAGGWGGGLPANFQILTLGNTNALYLYAAPGSAAVPEPGQVAASILLLAGIGGYVWLKRRRPAKPVPTL
jgi:T5SS/PEP-CTERM-associated repeat protein/autotransporter-associated beta strand protein